MKARNRLVLAELCAVGWCITWSMDARIVTIERPAYHESGLGWMDDCSITTGAVPTSLGQFSRPTLVYMVVCLFVCLFLVFFLNISRSVGRWKHRSEFRWYGNAAFQFVYQLVYGEAAVDSNQRRISNELDGDVVKRCGRKEIGEGTEKSYWRVAT